MPIWPRSSAGRSAWSCEQANRPRLPSIDDAITQVQAAGGPVVTAKTPIPNMGAFARVTDSEGNVVGLFSQNQ